MGTLLGGLSGFSQNVEQELWLRFLIGRGPTTSLSKCTELQYYGTFLARCRKLIKVLF